MSYVVKSKTYNGYLLPKAPLKFYSLGKTIAALNIRKAAGTNKKILAVIPIVISFADLAAGVFNK